MWRLRIRIAAAQSPPDWETVQQLLGELEQTYSFVTKRNAGPFELAYRAEERSRCGGGRIKEQLEHLDREMQSKRKGGLVSGPDFTPHANDLLQQMSAIVDALIVAVEESRFDDLEGLLGQRDVCPFRLGGIGPSPATASGVA